MNDKSMLEVAIEIMEGSNGPKNIYALIDEVMESAKLGDDANLKAQLYIDITTSAEFVYLGGEDDMWDLKSRQSLENWDKTFFENAVDGSEVDEDEEDEISMDEYNYVEEESDEEESDEDEDEDEDEVESYEIDESAGDEDEDEEDSWDDEDEDNSWDEDEEEKYNDMMDDYEDLYEDK